VREQAQRAVLAVLAVALMVASVVQVLTMTPAGPELVQAGPAGVAKPSGVDMAGLDRGVEVSQSLFEFANGGWLRKTDLPAGREEISTFSDLADRAQDAQRALLEQARDHPDDQLSRQLGDFYASCMDTAHRDQLKAAPLGPDFAAVDKLATPGDVLGYLGRMQRGDLTDPVKIEVRSDTHNAIDNIAVASQGQLTLPGPEYYLGQDPKNVRARDAYRAYVAKMMTLAGIVGGDLAATAVLDLETKLARTQAQGAAAVETAADTKLSLREAKDRTGLDFKAYFEAAGMGDVHQVVIPRPGYFSGLTHLVGTVPLPEWKTYLRWRLLSDAAPYLSSDFVTTHAQFVATVFGVDETAPDPWRRGVACVNAGMGEALGQLYTNRYYSEAADKRAGRLVRNIVAAFRDSIDTAGWLSLSAKDAARDKLTHLVIKIGHPHFLRDWSLLQVRRDDLIGNLRRSAELETTRDAAKSGRRVNPGDWNITPQTVSTGYDQTRNEITFPAALLQAPVFDVNGDDAVNYGAMGALIAREISRGFDDQGHLHDAGGNPRDWWTPADATAFAAKTGPLVDRYNGFTVADIHLNGQLTMRENVADLAGLTVAFAAYQSAQAAPKNEGGGRSPVLDGFTGPQRFFLGYAHLWRAKTREDAARQALSADPHSPAQFRTDAVVNNLDEFYTTWHVQPGDPAYLSPEQRAQIWSTRPAQPEHPLLAHQ
jgi:predicted metalloendopeptidase